MLKSSASLFLLGIIWGPPQLEVVSRALWVDSVSGAPVLLAGYQLGSGVFKGTR